MTCPNCNNKMFVIDSRDTKKGIRRRYSCKNCGHRITTYETPRSEKKPCDGCEYIKLRYPHPSLYPCNVCIRSNPRDYYTERGE